MQFFSIFLALLLMTAVVPALGLIMLLYWAFSIPNDNKHSLLVILFLGFVVTLPISIIICSIMALVYIRGENYIIAYGYLVIPLLDALLSRLLYVVYCRIEKID